MKQNVLMVWAISATIVAVAAIGYALGKHSALPAENVVSSAALNTTDGNGPHVSMPAFSIPARFKGAPAEWRSVLAKNDLQGYAVLFETATQTLIVEDCTHRGYEVDVNGRPVLSTAEFCKEVAWTSMVTLADDELVARTREGGTIQVALELDEQADPPVLHMSFDGHRAKLVPGSKQDLFVIMERVESIAKQKEAFHQASMASVVLTPEQLASLKREEERRQLEEKIPQQDAESVEDSAKEIPADIPRYVIEEAPPPTQ